MSVMLCTYVSIYGAIVFHFNHFTWTYQMAQTVRNLPAMEETKVHPLDGKIPGEEDGYPAQCSCLENPMDGGAW